MTCRAVDWRLGELHTGLVTRSAFHPNVTARKRHVCQTVIEAGLVELNNLGTPALVLGMTRLAVRLSSLR